MPSLDKKSHFPDKSTAENLCLQHLVRNKEFSLKCIRNKEIFLQC